MLNDKDIQQYADYIMGHSINWRYIANILTKFPEIDEAMVSMYKKGFQDGMDEMKQSCK